MTTRKDFLMGASALSGAALAGCATAPRAEIVHTRDLDAWQRETDLVTPDVYARYLAGRQDPAAYASLAKLESGFARVLAEIPTADVSQHPAVWLVYNMGVVVKTKESLFAVDLVHRRAAELAPMLDFALVTHNHSDHCHRGLYRALDGAGKTVVSNFLDNYGVKDWRKAGGFTRAEKVFQLKDVEIRTSLTDHNAYLVDFTTAFEIRVGDWRMYHSGDCSNVAKLNPVWGRPDLWVAFPGCGIDIAAGERKLRPKQMSFGHLWELGHDSGRLTTPMVKAARAKVQAEGGNVTVPLWGERIV